MKPHTWITALVFSAVVLSCERPVEDWPDPQVVLQPYGGCNQFEVKSDRLPGNQTCVQYRYVQDSILEFTHLNAGFNCCPEEIIVEVSLSGDTLFISESELNGWCDCNCLYDLDFSVYSVQPQAYVVVFKEWYRTGEDPELVFRVDLKNQQAGEYCVQRSRYPWGS